MADNAFVKIGTALLKHQVKKLVGEETLGVISEELADIGGDKLDAWLDDKSTIEELKKAAQTAHDCFHDSIGNHELEQWMVSLPIGDLPKVLEALEKLPTSPDEKQLEEAIRDSVAGWRNLSPEQIDKSVNSFLSCLRSALLPIEKQTLMVIGRSTLRTEEKVDVVKSTVTRSEEKIDLLIQLLEKQFITGKPATIESLKPEPVEFWNLKHPYAMPPHFTGRVDERKMLVDWLNDDSENRLFILRALGGFGKSALSWHWLTHDVDSKQWTKVLWWSFYEGDASFEHFIEETLKYLKLEVPQGGRPQVDTLLQAMQSQKILLIMDGFERALRAYSSMNAAYLGDDSPLPAGEGRGEGDSNQLDCVNINAEFFLKGVCSLPNIKSKILMTTRLTPRAVKPRGEFMLGCHEEELTAMQKADAVEFFYKQKIKGTHSEIESACEPYGYHPLSLRILAGLIVDDRKTPGDISVANKLEITDDIIQNKHHVLEVAYNTLSSEQQKLLSMIACFRSPINYEALKEISSKPLGKGKRAKTGSIDKLDDNLKTLETRGLLHWDRKTNKYDLHPIVRRYAYNHLTATERKGAHICLMEYFEAAPKPAKIEKLEDLALMIELYHHTIRAGLLDKAMDLYFQHIWRDIFYRFGVYQMEIELLRELFPNGEDQAPKLKREDAQAWTFNELGNSYGLSGQPSRAVLFYEKYISVAQKQKEVEEEAIGLVNQTLQQMLIGAIHTTEVNLLHCITICQRNKVRLWEAIGHQELGLLLTYRGLWNDAKRELDTSLMQAENQNEAQVKGITWSYQVLHILLMIRDSSQSKANLSKSAIQFAQYALDFAEEAARMKYPHERDFVRAHWLLGATNRINKKYGLAEHHLVEALNRCRMINVVASEANILLDLARLRYDQKKHEEAKNLADEALSITERCGYVLQGADVNLFLAQYALEQEKNKAKAKQYAETALKLATCDGPPYYYKVAYEEAERMLASLNV